MFIISINYIMNLLWISIKVYYQLSTKLKLFIFYNCIFFSSICIVEHMNGIYKFLFILGILILTYNINSAVVIYYDRKYSEEHDLGQYIKNKEKISYRSELELEIYRTISYGKDVVIDVFKDKALKIIAKKDNSIQNVIKYNNLKKDILMNGCIMYNNTKVAEIKNGNVNIIDRKRCPELITRTNNINLWLEDRACDGDRNNIKILKKKLKIEDKEDSEVVLYNYGMNLTDGFWFKHNECTMNFKKLRQNENNYESIVLCNKDVNFEPNKFTYELTNTGCMEKCWDYQFDKWFLLKNGRKNEVISESIASQIGIILGFNVVKYEVRRVLFTSGDIVFNEVSSCENFTTDNIYLECMYAFIGEDEGYKTNIDMLKKLEKENNCNLVYDYLNMLVLDYIIYNVDRHTHNYGVLKNFADGRVVSMAPIYDFNMSLLGNQCILRETAPKYMLDFFIDALKYSSVNYKLNKTEFDKLECDENIKEFIINNYNNINKKLKEVDN